MKIRLCTAQDQIVGDFVIAAVKPGPSLISYQGRIFHRYATATMDTEDMFGVCRNDTVIVYYAREWDDSPVPILSTTLTWKELP